MAGGDDRGAGGGVKALEYPGYGLNIAATPHTASDF